MRLWQTPWAWNTSVYLLNLDRMIASQLDAYDHERQQYFRENQTGSVYPCVVTREQFIFFCHMSKKIAVYDIILCFLPRAINARGERARTKCEGGHRPPFVRTPSNGIWSMNLFEPSRMLWRCILHCGTNHSKFLQKIRNVICSSKASISSKSTIQGRDLQYKYILAAKLSRWERMLRRSVDFQRLLWPSRFLI